MFVLAIDEAKDLTLLKTDAVVKTLPPFRTDARLGESVYAFGFPLAGLLASSGNFTSGNITANAAIEDDITRMQISAPVQPGNSGGPLLDQFGNIVGVVVANSTRSSTLKSLKTCLRTSTSRLSRR